MDFSKEEPNLLSDSDDSDEDYVPPGAESNPPSEVESDGDDEDPPESDDEDPSSKKRKKGQKASKKKARKKNRKSAPKEVNTEEKDDDDDDDDNKNNDKKVLSEEEEKKRADSLWADFMSDSKSLKTQPKKITPVNKKHEEIEEKKDKAEPKKEEKENKVVITEVFEFAGEEVKVTKEVDVASKEARIAQAAPKSVGSSSSGSPISRGRGRGSGGLSSILGQIGKKSKIGTLEKSKLDWDRFKKSEGIEDELRTFNRGKDGYLEKQDFLQRADLRQFEIEKSLRATRRSNR